MRTIKSDSSSAQPPIAGRRTNIDPDSKAEKARQRKMLEQREASRDWLRNLVGCPMCKARVGEYCAGPQGLRKSHHAARWEAGKSRNRKARPRSTEVPQDVQEFIAKHGVTVCAPAAAKGYGGIRPPAARSHAAAETAAMAQNRLRGQRNRG